MKTFELCLGYLSMILMKYMSMNPIILVGLYFYRLDRYISKKYSNYTSMCLLMPVVCDYGYLDFWRFTFLVNMVSMSHVHHSQKTLWTRKCDKTCIAMCCMMYISGNWMYSLMYGLCTYLSIMYLDNTMMCDFYFLMTYMYYCYRIKWLVTVYACVMTGYYRYRVYTDSLLWHVSNGVFLTIVSMYSPVEKVS